MWPIKDLIESGSLVIPGSDWAVVPSVNPWLAVESLMTRERPGGSEASFGKAQSISLDQALKLFTVNSAKHLKRDHELGDLSAGKLADIIVVNQDPYKIPTTDIHKTAVSLTIVEGEIIYSRPK